MFQPWECALYRTNAHFMPGWAPVLLSLHVLEFEDNALSSSTLSPQRRGSVWIGTEVLSPLVGGKPSFIVNSLDSITGTQLRQNVSTSLCLVLPGKVHPDHLKPLLLRDIGRLQAVLHMDQMPADRRPNRLTDGSRRQGERRRFEFRQHAPRGK